MEWDKLLPKVFHHCLQHWARTSSERGSRGDLGSTYLSLVALSLWTTLLSILLENNFGQHYFLPCGQHYCLFMWTTRMSFNDDDYDGMGRESMFAMFALLIFLIAPLHCDIIKMIIKITIRMIITVIWMAIPPLYSS